MKVIAKVLILALVCHLALGEPVAANTTANSTNSTQNATKIVRYCEDTNFWNGTACSKCPAGCEKCVYKNKAVSCITCLKANSFLLIKDDIGSCPDCAANCAACRGPATTDCIDLVKDHSLNPTDKLINDCKQANCQYCAANGSCALCQYKFRVDDKGGCTPCSDSKCAQCNASTTNCNKCMSGFWFESNTSCKACADNCVACNSTSCQLCAQTHTLANGTCVAKPTCPSNATAHCNACDDKKACIGCEAGFYLNGTGVNATCAACAAHCLQCTKDACTVCKGWDEGFTYSLNDKTCTKCADTNCNKCGADGLCTQCYPNYYVDATKKTCTKCVDGCLSCTDKGCTQCQATKILINPGKVDASCKSWSSCKFGDQFDAAGNCTAGVIDNCEYGDAVTKTCLLCATGYFADADKCTTCPNGCTHCSKNATTGYLTCTESFGGDHSTVWKVFHNTSANAKSDALGYLCRDGCSHCDDDLNCTACMPNRIFTQSLVHANSHFCLPYEQCPQPTANGLCYSDNRNHTTATVNQAAPGTEKPKAAGKLVMTFVVAVIAAIFVV